jgi:hypothetical protein
MTRTDQRLDVGFGEGQLWSIDVGRLSRAALSAARADNGKLANALVLDFGDGASPVSLEGSRALLTEVHDRIIEIMLERAPEQDAPPGQPRMYRPE